MIKKIKNWLTELRAPFLTATLVSIILGTVIAWTRNNSFNPAIFALALIGGVCAHLGTNVANDYFDHQSRNDDINKEFVRPFSGGSRTIQQGLLTPREVLGGSLFFFAAATLIGAYLTLMNRPIVIAFILIGLISGFFYTARPFSWASKGVGEAIVGINFGALMTLGAYYVQTQTLDLEPVVASIPTALLILAVLYINEFPDYVADKEVGKRTLVVRLGRAKAAIGYAVIMLVVYAAVFLSALFGITPLYTLVALIALPLAAASVQHALKFHSEPFKLAPSNGATIILHLLTSLLVSFGYLLQGFAFLTPGYLIVIVAVGICSLVIANFFLKVRSATEQMGHQ